MWDILHILLKPYTNDLGIQLFNITHMTIALFSYSGFADGIKNLKIFENLCSGKR